MTNEQIERLKEVLSVTLENNDLCVKVVEPNENQSELRVYIIRKQDINTERKNLVFEIQVSADRYHTKGKYSFWFNDSFTHSWRVQEKADSTGWRNNNTIRYEYENLLSYAVLAEYGLEKSDYRYPTRQLNFDSKIDKNPKLIVNDFMKSYTVYSKIIALVEPILVEKIESAEKIVEQNNFLNSIYRMKKHYPMCNDFQPRNQSFDLGHSKIERDTYGNFSITQPINFDDVVTMLSNFKGDNSNE